MKCATLICEKRLTEMPKLPKQANAPGKIGKFADLPVLTEVPETDANLPVLTEILENELPAAKQIIAPLSDAQCVQLAEKLAPQLDALLREKLTLRLANAWLEAWGEVKAELPGLIRAELAKTSPSPKK